MTSTIPTQRRFLPAFSLVILLLLALIAFFEWQGWPFLAAPAQRALSNMLHRDVHFGDPSGPPQLRVHLLGHLKIAAPRIEIGAPSWSKAPPMLVAENAVLVLDWTALWKAWRGQPLVVRELHATRADIEVERLTDGRASWQFDASKPGQAATPLPQFGRLTIDNGSVRWTDALLAADVQAHFALRDGREGLMPAAFPTASAAASVASAANSASAPLAAASAANGLHVDAKGRWKGLPLAAQLHTSGLLPWVSGDAAAPAVPVQLHGNLGGARLNFQGSVTDALHFNAMHGRYTLGGPSLAAVGDVLGVTLPTTHPFQTQGLVAREGDVWRLVIESARVGDSRLNGAFSFDQSRAKPLLAGRLGGNMLKLADLAPAIGKQERHSRAPSAAASAADSAQPGRVLPDRAFDLPSLRAMDANVLVDIETVDLNTGGLEPLHPLRGHLKLANGVLTLTDLDARTAQGRVGGSVQLDGQSARAQWSTDLHWDDIRLENFIHQTRAKGAPPWIAGQLRGQAKLAGEGRSTASILASLRGNVRTQLRDGAVSHLAVEAGGLDVAQALGVLVRGDQALPVQCAVADLTVDKGRMTPRVMVIDTLDSALWIDGSLSLADESLDLRAVVSPKDFSPLTLRTPIHVRGSFSAPEVSLEKGPLVRTIGGAALLALINPLAALIPLFDQAQTAQADRGAAGCTDLVRRGQAARAVPPRKAKR